MDFPPPEMGAGLIRKIFASYMQEVPDVISERIDTMTGFLTEAQPEQWNEPPLSHCNPCSTVENLI